MLIERCFCGEAEFEEDWAHGLRMRACLHCGAAHQAVEMTLDDLGDYYRRRYMSEVYEHGFSHDLEVARRRLRAYGGLVNGRILDVGAGTGAFVEAARQAGHDAWGQDLAEGAAVASSERIYAGQELASVHFPTDHFDAVTLHDVLEHVPDPLALLREVKRITRQGGTIVVDFPAFHDPAGLHHWKAVEHLWMLTPEQLQDLIARAGIRPLYQARPIPSKVVMYAQAPAESRASILIPPGIGDGYWSLTKIRSFCERHQLGIPDVWVSQPDNKPRSLEFVRRIPFVNAAGYREHSTATDPIWREAYMNNARSIFRNVAGCDYFIAFNGVLRYNRSLDDNIFPELATEWFLPLWRSLEEERFGQECRRQWGDYVVAYFVPHGMYRNWLKEFPVQAIQETLLKIRAAGLKIVFMGAGWDVGTTPAQIMASLDGARADFVDLCGQTSLDEMIGLIRYARGVIGWPAGNTILATTFRIPTLLLWNDYFGRGFWRYSCPPQALGRWYQPMDTRTTRPVQAAERFLGLMKGAAR